jgi:hypothetical protein
MQQSEGDLRMMPYFNSARIALYERCNLIECVGKSR